MNQPPVTPQPAPPGSPSRPGTQEIPVVAPPGGSAGQTQQLPRTTPAPQQAVPSTGPVDLVPGLPGAGAPPPPAATVTPRRRTPQDRAALLGAGLALLSLVLLELGLALRFGSESYWAAVPLWSGFATLATLLGLLPFAAHLLRRSSLRPGAAWKVAAGGLTGVAVFWVLVVLPRVDSDRGFVLTAALAALGAALWIAPARRAA